MIDPKYITISREPFFQMAFDYILPESRVLDIGAGDGSFAKFCQRDDFYLYDGNLETVQKLKTNFSNSFYGVLPELPFDDEVFDVVHCSHVIEHLQPQELYDTLIQIDRVLKDGGQLVISTPLLWEGFYNDLSHVKPYPPFVLEKYLTGNHSENLTRDIISKKYSIKKLEYRYIDAPNLVVFSEKKDLFVRIFLSMRYRLRKRGLRNLVKSGYTIILEKNA